MKISLNWLKDYVEVAYSAPEIAEILSNGGFPCEGIEYLDDDTILDIEITSNRGDCLGHIGIARELAAATGKELKLPEVVLEESETEAVDCIGVEIEAPELCGRYTGRLIEGVKVGPTPEWMRKRLEAIGMRSVSNVVDATNYAMAETGQPPHAFDYKKITDGKIIVRRAKAGETIVSIDGTKCELSGDMLIIADPKGPVAVAGVMGGLYTEVGDDTTAILLEDAHFDPVSVRTTSRKLNLPSEAAFRFERIVDIENVDWASRRTAQLIIQAAGGRAAKGVVDVYPGKREQKKTALRLSRLNKLLGIEVPPEEAVNILARLQFKPERKNDTIECIVPFWRNDVYREADLIEEVARVYGYGKVPTEKKIEIEVRGVDERDRLSRFIGSFLNGCGYYETVNITFVEDSIARLFVSEEHAEHLAVKDVSRRSANLLRQTLICSLLEVVKTNLNFKNTPCRIFEIADTFVPAGAGELPVEKTMLGMAFDGDMSELKGTIEGLIKSLDRQANISFVPADLVWAKAGADIMVNGDVIGTVGVVSEKVQGKFDFNQAVPCAAEIEFEKLGELYKQEIKFASIPKFPAIVRDISIVVDDKIRWSEIEGTVLEGRPQELEELCFVGIYQGKGIQAGKKSVTFSLQFRDDDGTLTHEKVDDLQNAIVERLNQTAGAELRTV